MNYKEILREYEDKESKSAYVVCQELMRSHSPRDNIDSGLDSEDMEEILSGLTIGKFPQELRAIQNQSTEDYDKNEIPCFCEY